MKSFKEFISESENRSLANQTIPFNKQTQAALNAARPTKPGGKQLPPVTFSLQTVSNLK